MSTTCRVQVVTSGNHAAVSEGRFSIAQVPAPRVLLWQRWSSEDDTSTASRVAQILTARLSRIDMRTSETLDPQVLEAEYRESGGYFFKSPGVQNKSYTRIVLILIS